MEEQKTTIGEPKSDPDFEAMCPKENYPDIIHVFFKHEFQGQPIMLNIRGGRYLAEEIMKGGRHAVTKSDGREIIFNGNDVLWAECISAQENRQNAIDRARAQHEAQEAEVAKKAAKDKAAKEKAEAEARAAEEAKKHRGRFRRL